LGAPPPPHGNPGMPGLSCQALLAQQLNGGGMTEARHPPAPGSTGALSARGTEASAQCSSSCSASSPYAYLFPGFLSVGGISKFAQSWPPLALSMAQAILMLTGGISLAIGALVSLGVVIAAMTMDGPLGLLGGAAAVMAAGLGIGAISGLIVVRLHMPAIIITLAGTFIIGGAALIILPRPGGAIPSGSPTSSPATRRSPSPSPSLKLAELDDRARRRRRRPRRPHLCGEAGRRRLRDQ
jgi:hypothetical protein